MVNLHKRALLPQRPAFGGNEARSWRLRFGTIANLPRVAVPSLSVFMDLLLEDAYNKEGIRILIWPIAGLKHWSKTKLRDPVFLDPGNEAGSLSLV